MGSGGMCSPSELGLHGWQSLLVASPAQMWSSCLPVAAVQSRGTEKNQFIDILSEGWGGVDCNLICEE